jgi:hypothetical protein
MENDMKVTLVDKDYMMVKPMVVRTKSEGGLFVDPKAGLKSNVLTYLVTDCNGEKKYQDKIVGIMRSEVWPFETMNDVKRYLVKKVCVIFTVDLEKGEESVDPYSQAEYDKQVSRSSIIV